MAAPRVLVVDDERFFREAVRDALDGLALRFVDNAQFADGMSTSVAAGIGALPEGMDGALVTLGDMPRVGSDHQHVHVTGGTFGERGFAGRKIELPHANK